MSWGGSARAANDSLKNIRRILGKRLGLFSKEKRYSQTKQLLVNYTGGISQLGKLDPEERKKIKETIRKKQRVDNYVTLLISLIIAPLLIWGVISFIGEKPIDANSNNQSQHLKLEKKYLKYLMYGDTWMEDKKWDPAIQMYKKALKIYPSSYDGTYRLVLAYSYKCKKMKYDCHLGLSILDSLKLQHPKKRKELMILDSIFKRNKMDFYELN